MSTAETKLNDITSAETLTEVKANFFFAKVVCPTHSILPPKMSSWHHATQVFQSNVKKSHDQSSKLHTWSCNPPSPAKGMQHYLINKVSYPAFSAFEHQAWLLTSPVPSTRQTQPLYPTRHVSRKWECQRRTKEPAWSYQPVRKWNWWCHQPPCWALLGANAI